MTRKHREAVATSVTRRDLSFPELLQRHERGLWLGDELQDRILLDPAGSLCSLLQEVTRENGLVPVVRVVLNQDRQCLHTLGEDPAILLPGLEIGLEDLVKEFAIIMVVVNTSGGDCGRHGPIFPNQSAFLVAIHRRTGYLNWHGI